MLSVKPFFDYNIPVDCLENNYESVIKLLFNYGYRTIAINQVLDCTELEQRKKKKKGDRDGFDPVPDPVEIKTVPGCEEMVILNRLTLVFSNQDVLHKIVKTENYKKYHLIAVLPTSAKATLFVSTSFDADIFCFDPESKEHIKKTRKTYRQLVERGYHFEVPYGPAIEDSSKRKNIIHMSHLYHAFFKSKNVILSSGASTSLQIRGPYDIINLGLIFGLNEQQAKDAITHSGRQVFLNSVGRRHGKAVMFVEDLTKECEETMDTSVEVIDLQMSDEDIETEAPMMKKAKK